MAKKNLNFMIIYVFMLITSLQIYTCKMNIPKN